MRKMLQKDISEMVDVFTNMKRETETCKRLLEDFQYKVQNQQDQFNNDVKTTISNFVSLYFIIVPNIPYSTSSGCGDKHNTLS